MQVANHPNFVKEPRRYSCEHLIECQLQYHFFSCGYDECDCDTKSRFRTPQTSTGGLSLFLLFGASVVELGLASRAALSPHRGQGRSPARPCRASPRRRSGLCLSLRLLPTLTLCSVPAGGEISGAFSCAHARCMCVVVFVWALLSSTSLSLLGHRRAHRHQRCEPSQPAHDGRLCGDLPSPHLSTRHHLVAGTGAGRPSLTCPRLVAAACLHRAASRSWVRPPLPFARCCRTFSPLRTTPMSTSTAGARCASFWRP